MRKHTHAILGAPFAVMLGAAWIRAPLEVRLMLDFLNPFKTNPFFLSGKFSRGLFLLLQGSVFGVLPDIDLVFKWVLDHRCGLTHSLISVAVFFPLLTILVNVSPLVGLLCTFSHWVSNAVTIQGVRTWGLSLDFFLGHKCDFRLAKLKSNNKMMNSLFYVACLLVLGALF